VEFKKSTFLVGYEFACLLFILTCKMLNSTIVYTLYVLFQIGYVMFYVRTPQTYGQESIAGALALLWQVTSYMHTNC